MQKVIMLCGVPASGKTWVLQRLKDKFTRVENDMHLGLSKYELAKVCESRSHTVAKPVIVDVPFAERELRSELENLGMEVTPVFIVESPSVVKTRYAMRGQNPCPQNIITRAETIANRAKEWNAKQGTSSEILEYLLNTTF